jgi:hypothetical protein
MSDRRMTQEDWLNHLIASLSNPSLLSPQGDPMPGFPSDELQRNTTSISGEQALRQASSFYGDICKVMEASGSELNAASSVMDFGSCWGRITRFFMRDVSLAHLHGIDVSQEFVDECKQLFGTTNFHVCNAMPPCQVSDASIQLVSAYSVFSHLSERAFMAWMSEFHRILRPGGVLAFTTRSEIFLDYCARLRESSEELAGYPKALAAMIPDVFAARQRYRAGEFLFATGQGLSGGGAMNETFYGEAFVPEAYVRQHLSDRFEVLQFKAVGSAYDQALFVLKKRD